MKSATAAEVALPAKPSLQLMALSALVASASHVQEMRRARFLPKEIEDLADDIKRNGMMHQPIVRLIAAGKHEGKHEIITGERRWLAAKHLGLKEIYVNVREIGDDQALEMQLSENLRRKDLHELEEAEGYEELMKLKKISADIVADIVGRSRSYVDKRTKLLALCPEARKAFYAGEIDASKALLIARIGHHDTQRAALKDLTAGRFGAGPMSYREAVDHVQREYMLRLKDAPFDLNDAQLLPKAGSCQACPKRTGNQKELFADVKSADICTDPKCFDDKRQAVYFVAVKAIEAKGKKVLHGDAAKKIFPHWKNGSSSMAGGYVLLTESTYASGRQQKVADLLGKDYQPILVQHPANGKIIEVATQQAVAKASNDPKAVKRATATAASKPKGPDVDEMLTDRLAQLIHKKAPKQFGRAWHLDLAKQIYSKLNLRDKEAVAKAWGWPANAFRSSGYGSSLPAQAAKLGERDLILLMFHLCFATGYYDRAGVLKLFGIDEAKTRILIIAERKKAAADARAARKSKTAKK